ncbi:MAG: Fe-S cluster domain protein [Methanothrix sp.]|nr:Fe-S cluster domain protein [Methanothrix sp.]
MVAGFEGVVSRGRRPEVGETVRFLPEHCMMQKVHSGMVVHSEGEDGEDRGDRSDGVVAE